jgi:gliding motility-associated protein GldE
MGTDKKSRVIADLIDRPKVLLATILIANNFVNVTMVIIFSYITTLLFDPARYPVLTFFIQVVVITSIILFFGEILPKVYASRYPLQVCQVMAGPMKMVIRIFNPLSQILVRSTSLIDRRISKRGYIISMSELSEAFEITSDAGTPEEERKILKGIVNFVDIEVKEIMKPRMDVTSLDASSDFSLVLKTIRESGYSRIPVYAETFDNILGVLYAKDLLPYLEKDHSFRWQELLRPAFFVPENKKISDLLQEIRVKKIHLAIVVDEYGGTSGIVTLEDIIEEIIGEISDEFDIPGEDLNYTRIDDHNYIFEAKTSLNDFFKVTGVDDDAFDVVKGDADTLAGLLLELSGKIPLKDEVISFGRFDFKILGADNRRIKKVRVAIRDADTTE